MERGCQMETKTISARSSLLMSLLVDVMTFPPLTWPIFLPWWNQSKAQLWSNRCHDALLCQFCYRKLRLPVNKVLINNIRIFNERDSLHYVSFCTSPLRSLELTATAGVWLISFFRRTSAMRKITSTMTHRSLVFTSPTTTRMKRDNCRKFLFACRVVAKFLCKHNEKSERR